MKEPDQALVDGPLPMFLLSKDLKALQMHLFGHGGAEDGVEFGARQAILVRTQDAKQEVYNEVRSGVVMTIYEAKGMEFDGTGCYCAVHHIKSVQHRCVTLELFQGLSCWRE